MLVVPPRIWRSQGGWLMLVAILGLAILADTPAAAEQSLLPKPRQYLAALKKAQTVFIQVTAGSLAGTIETTPLIETVVHRMNELGYSSITQPSRPYDVKVEFSCFAGEQPTVLKGQPENSRSRFLPQASGPPCHFRYVYMGKEMAWQRIDRIVFTLGVQTAKRIQEDTVTRNPMELFQRYLEGYDFPLLLTAEWGQSDRLIKYLKSPDTDPVRKKRVLSLLGEIRSSEAIPCLIMFLEEEDFRQPAVLALGHFGADVRPPLIQLLRYARRSDVKAAAANSLGRIGATTGDWSLAPLFVEMLEDPTLDITVQIELVWALGKNHDRVALPLLEKLYDRVWTKPITGSATA